MDLRLQTPTTIMRVAIGLMARGRWHDSRTREASLDCLAPFKTKGLLQFEGPDCFWPSGVREIRPEIMPALGSLFATLTRIEHRPEAECNKGRRVADPFGGPSIGLISHAFTGRSKLSAIRNRGVTD